MVRLVLEQATITLTVALAIMAQTQDPNLLSLPILVSLKIITVQVLPVESAMVEILWQGTHFNKKTNYSSNNQLKYNPILISTGLFNSKLQATQVALFLLRQIALGYQEPLVSSILARIII